MDVQKCSSCGAAILWVKTKRGASMPIDAEPCEGGNLYLAGTLVEYVKKGEALLPGVPLYKSHFATCVNAAHHRKEK